MADKYDSIRELDKEAVGKSKLPEMLIASYMVPPSFVDIFAPEKIEHIRNVMTTPAKLADRSTRIRVKNINTGVSFEFSKMVNVARFVGTTIGNVKGGITFETARGYCIGGEEYVFVYDDKERPIEGCTTTELLTNGLVDVVSSTGERTSFFDYLSVAQHLGLLVGHIIEEEKRAWNKELAKVYVIGGRRYTIEFFWEKREMSQSQGIRCHWKGIYDGDWEKIHCIKVTC